MGFASRSHYWHKVGGGGIIEKFSWGRPKYSWFRLRNIYILIRVNVLRHGFTEFFLIFKALKGLHHEKDPSFFIADFPKTLLFHLLYACLMLDIPPTFVRFMVVIGIKIKRWIKNEAFQEKKYFDYVHSDLRTDDFVYYDIRSL